MISWISLEALKLGPVFSMLLPSPSPSARTTKVRHLWRGAAEDKPGRQRTVYVTGSRGQNTSCKRRMVL